MSKSERVLAAGGGVQANDFGGLWREIREDAGRAFARVGSSARFVLGDEVVRFEKALAASWGLPQAVGVGCGMDAIEIALRILGCGTGDRVLTTPVSAFATTLAILKLGAVPVFADTDETGQLDLEECRRVLSAVPGIRYFVPVHLYGQPLDLPELRRLRDDFGLRMVEDCAQSVGARWGAEPTGSVGQMAATSFYPTKNLGAMGDAGAIVTGDALLAGRAREFRDYGQTAKYKHSYLGYNSRLDELQAAILHDACLPRLEQWTRRRRQVAESYLRGIRHRGVRLLQPAAASSGCWHLFPVFVEPALRASFLEYLVAAGVGAAVHYPVGIPDQPVMQGQRFEMPGTCRKAREVCAGEVSLPIHPYLTDEQIACVIAAVNRWPAEDSIRSRRSI